MIVPHTNPRISVALRSPRLARVGDMISAAERAGILEVDLDVTGRRLSDPAGIARGATNVGVAVRSIWLPDRSSTRMGSRRRHLADDVARLAHELHPQSVIVDRPLNREDGQQTSLIRELKAALPAEIRLVYVLRPGSLAGTRDHLADLTAVRRNAEEWDLDLALDLHGPIDAKWEAEAAITKLRSRLTTVRFGPLTSRPPGRGRERATTRVLATLADSMFTGVISITPQVPLLRLPTTSVLATSCLDTVRFIRSRYELVQGVLPDRILNEYWHPNETRKDGTGWR